MVQQSGVLKRDGLMLPNGPLKSQEWLKHLIDLSLQLIIYL